VAYGDHGLGGKYPQLTSKFITNITCTMTVCALESAPSYPDTCVTLTLASAMGHNVNHRDTSYKVTNGLQNKEIKL